MTRTHILTLLARITLAVVLVAAVIALTTRVSDLSGRIQAQQNRLGVSLLSQNRNRASNVDRWCRAINHDRRVLVLYVAAAAIRSPGIAPLKLRQLPCAQLEKATVASTHPTKP